MTFWSTAARTADESNDDAPKSETANVEDPQTFSFGSKVELLAIGDPDEGRPAWWNAVGEPLEDVPFEWIESPSFAKNNLQWRRLLLRIDRLPEGAEVRWETGKRNSWGASASFREEVEGSKLLAKTVALAEDERMIDMRFGIATGAWRTVTKIGATGTGATGRNGISVVYSGAFETDRGTTTVVSHNDFDHNFRVVAIDKHGKLHDSTGRGGVSAGKIYQIKPTFPNLSPDDIDRFEFQIRDYEWVQIEDLPLHPGSSDKTSAIVPERTLQFPGDRALGMLFTRPAAAGDFGFEGNSGEGWQELALATGAVTVPTGQHVRLDVSLAASADLRPLAELPPDAIQFLSLRSTDVTDDGLKPVGHLTGLRFLNLDGTKITDEGVSHLANLHQLQTLKLSAFDVHLQGYGVGDAAMKVVARLPTLESIDLRRTKITDEGLATLAMCQTLRGVGLDETAVTDAGLKYLKKMPNLRWLSLRVYRGESTITDEGTAMLAQIPSLRFLDLSGTRITDEGLRHLAVLTKLKRLSIDNTQVTEEGLVHLANMQDLENLYVYNTITDESVPHISRLKGLKQLSANLEISDESVALLATLPLLEYLSLSGPRITDKALEDIAQMPSLTSLWFQGCSITDRGLARLRNSRNLEHLMIWRTNVTTAGLRHLMTLPNLNHLDLKLKTEPKPNWEHLKWFAQVRDLRLNGPSIRNADLAHLQGLTELTQLNLQMDEPLDDTGIAFLEPLTNLKNVWINHSVVTDKGLVSLSRMTDLERLNLSCLATDRGLLALSKLNSLHFLQIASPYVSKEGIAALGKQLPSLQDVNHYEYRLDHTDISVSRNDPLFRRGEPDERPPKDALENKLPPPLTVENWLNTDGKPLTVADLHGKVVLVNFWGARISSSRMKLPAQKQLYEKYHDQGLEIIGVHMTWEAESLNAAIKQQGIGWPVCADVDEQTVAAWHVDGYPGYYLLDRTGTLRYADIYHGHLETAVKMLLAEQTDGSVQNGSNDATKGRRFELLVVGPDKQPVPQVLVEVRSEAAPTAEQIVVGEYVRPATYGSFVRTDAEGRLVLQLADEQPRRFNLSIKTAGYGPYWAGWSTVEHPQPIPSRFVAELEGGWSVGGVVVDTKGQPIEGVNVKPSIKFNKRPGDVDELHVGARAKTDAAGRWRFDSVPASKSEVFVEVGHPDFKPNRRPLTRDAFGLALDAQPTETIALDRGETVTGRVTDEDGEPIVGALLRTKFLNDIRKATTDENGEYRLAGCEPRMAKIVVTAAGKAVDMQQVRIGPELGPVDFQMQPGGTVRIRVLDEHGNPLPRARIFFQKWRDDGFRGYDYFEFGHVDQYTDEDGVWEWHGAPLDEFKADIGHPRHMELGRQSLLARDEEYVFRLPPTLVITGKVIDKQSRKPIPKFRVTPGVRSSETHMNWVRGNGFEVNDGEYRLRHQHDDFAHLLRIEAEGYEIAVSRDVKSNEGHVQIDFELNPARDVVVTLLTPEGEPAAGAKVALGTAGSQITVTNGDLDDGSTLSSRRDADDEGKFRFPTQNTDYQLVVTHSSGFAYLKSAEEEIPEAITLTPWARVEGVFRVGPTPVANVKITLATETIHAYGKDVPNIFTHHYVTTGADGRYVFERVVPGKGRIGRNILFMVRDGAAEVTSSKRLPAHFPSGEATKLDLGGDGRAVVGKLAPRPGVDEPVLWNFAIVNARLDHPHAKRPTPPPDVQKDAERLKAWWEDWQESPQGKVWQLQTEAHQKLRDASPYFTATVDRDGTFRIDDVEPGNYVLSVRFSDHAAGHLLGFRFSVPVAADVASPPPLDLGLLQLE